jgi:hypothetical protein
VGGVEEGKVPDSGGDGTMIDMSGDTTIVKCYNCVDFPSFHVFFYYFGDEISIPPDFRIVLQCPDVSATEGGKRLVIDHYTTITADYS